MTEAEMWAQVKKLHPRAERMESAVTSGFPDCIIPTSEGWVLVELKVVRGSYITFQKSQLSFFVRNKHLTGRSEPKILVYYGVKHGYRILTVLDLIGHAEAFEGKIRIKYDKDHSHWSLEGALDQVLK